MNVQNATISAAAGAVPSEQQIAAWRDIFSKPIAGGPITRGFDLYFGTSGFGTYNSAMPSPTGAKTSFKFLTPLIDIPTWSMYDASAGLTNVVFADRP